jgi:hypothetical protein
MAGPGRPPNPPSPKKMLQEILPIHDIFQEDEVELYNKLVAVYLDDFEAEDLTSSDMDDILDLAKNRVLEFRLLKEGKHSADRQLDVAATIEKLGKKNEKIKENLSSRRRDRINPNEFKGFSIVDMAVAHDAERKAELANKLKKLKEEEKEMLKKREEYTGNRYDADVKERDFDNE